MSIGKADIPGVSEMQACQHFTKSQNPNLLQATVAVLVLLLAVQSMKRTHSHILTYL